MVKSVKISCDWYQDLKMYQIPEKYSLSLIEEFPNISLIPVNCPGLPDYDESSRIYLVIASMKKHKKNA